MSSKLEKHSRRAAQKAVKSVLSPEVQRGVNLTQEAILKRLLKKYGLPPHVLGYITGANDIVIDSAYLNEVIHRDGLKELPISYRPIDEKAAGIYMQLVSQWITAKLDELHRAQDERDTLTARIITSTFPILALTATVISSILATDATVRIELIMLGLGTVMILLGYLQQGVMERLMLQHRAVVGPKNLLRIFLRTIGYLHIEKHAATEKLSTALEVILTTEEVGQSEPPSESLPRRTKVHYRGGIVFTIGGSALVCISGAALWFIVPSMHLPWPILNQMVRVACIATIAFTIVVSKLIVDSLFQTWLCSMAKSRTVANEFLIILLAKGCKFFPTHPETLRLMRIPANTIQ